MTTKTMEQMRTQLVAALDVIVGDQALSVDQVFYLLMYVAYEMALFANDSDVEDASGWCHKMIDFLEADELAGTDPEFPPPAQWTLN